MNTSWKKYLSTKAIIAPIIPEPDSRYEIAVVMPAYAEDEFIDATLDSLPIHHEDILIVIVINHPPGVTTEELENNRRVVEKLRKRDISYIDAGEVTGGVGEARKTGMDSVLPFLKQRGIICCLDGDSPVEENYFDAIRKAFLDAPDCAGGVVKFCHPVSNDSQVNQAIIDYEIWLRYYVYALKYAASPYAFFTIGSTIVCRAEAYIKAGGMRIRSAAEDFYFLQALSKVGPIIDIIETVVYPSPRPSPRVPFGTGRKVGEMLDGAEIKLYNPIIFDLLKELLTQVELCTDFSNLTECFEQNLAMPTLKFLENNCFTENWHKIYRNTAKNNPARKQAFHTWFDAFRTLKFVHFCETEYAEQFGRCEIMAALPVMLPGIEFHSKQNALSVLRDLT
jgi:glycosyltransferase involved in cell wall biosynthesis